MCSSLSESLQRALFSDLYDYEQVSELLQNVKGKILKFPLFYCDLFCLEPLESGQLCLTQRHG